VAGDDWQREWDVTAAAIGTDYGGEPEEAIEAVELSSIRRFCEPLEFDCPLHYDAEVARAHAYRDVLAPWSGISQTFNRRGHWRPGMSTRYPAPDRDAVILDTELGVDPEPPSPPYRSTFATDLEIEYHAPVCVGDRLTRTGRVLIGVVPRETSVGRGAFLSFEGRLHNQRGELVTVQRNGSYRYTPAVSAQDGAGGAPPPAPPPPARELPPALASNVDWSLQRYVEDVAVGDEIPPLAIHLTIARLVVEAGGNLDFSRVHHNVDVAHATGAPDMYANNVFIQGWWERAVREYIGLAGRVRRVGPLRMRVFNTVGETVVTRGVVKRIWEEEGEHLVELEMRSEISRGVSVGPGPVVVSLPSRGG
jgi:acyl dehydratase